ncbi:MAG: DUF951 domain-containing protein [Acholeplasmataceae bacterium]
MKYFVNDIIQTKKKHVCGANTWTIIRSGIEVKIKCNGCGREVMMLKTELDKKTIKKQEDTTK